MSRGGDGSSGQMIVGRLANDCCCWIEAADCLALGRWWYLPLLR